LTDFLKLITFTVRHQGQQHNKKHNIRRGIIHEKRPPRSKKSPLRPKTPTHTEMVLIKTYRNDQESCVQGDDVKLWVSARQQRKGKRKSDGDVGRNPQTGASIPSRPAAGPLQGGKELKPTRPLIRQPTEIGNARAGIENVGFFIGIRLANCQGLVLKCKISMLSEHL